MKYPAIVIALVCASSNSFAQASKPLTPDEAAMVLATMVVTTSACGAKATDEPLNIAIARHGQDLVDFQPGNRYAPLVQVKMKKAYEFIQMQGKDKACEGMIWTVNRFLPGSIR